MYSGMWTLHYSANLFLLRSHHVRFFPKEYVSHSFPHECRRNLPTIPVHRRAQADNSGNCPAGLLVDKHITNPNYPDFYLQSHAGLLGSEHIVHRCCGFKLITTL